MNQVNISSEVIERATILRAKYNFKTPDAIHLVSAIEVGAAVFLTGDKLLSRCAEITVVLL